MFFVPNFDERDKEKEIAAYDQISQIPKYILQYHLKVFQSFFVLLIILCSDIVKFPYVIFKSIRDRSQQSKNVIAISFSLITTLVLFKLFGIDFDSGLRLMNAQSIYKLWAIYTLFQIIIKFLMKVHVFTHKAIRGAIRKGEKLYIPILLHSLSNALLFGCYSIYNGCYLAGLYGKKNIIFSASIHIQAIIAKKFFPKILETPPVINESINLFVLLFAVVDHLRVGRLSKIKDLVLYHFVCLFVRFVLTALTEDSSKFYKSVCDGAASVCAQFHGSAERTDSSLMLTFPSEVFYLSMFYLFDMGPVFNSAILFACVLLLGLVGPRFIPSPVPQETPTNPQKKEDDVKCKKNE